MSTPREVTDEQIAAARLRVELDRKLGRETPALVRAIATGTTPPRAEPPEKIAPVAELFSAETAVDPPGDDSATLRARIESHPNWPFRAEGQAAETFDEANSRLRGAWNQTLLAVEAAERGDHTQAERLLQQALTFYANLQQNLADSQVFVRALLAKTYRDLGQPRRALSAFDQVNPFPQSPEHVAGFGRREEGLLSLARADAYLSVGQYPFARAHAARARDHFREIGDRAGEATALTKLGTIYEFLDQPDEAGESARLAHDIRRELGS